MVIGPSEVDPETYTSAFRIKARRIVHKQVPSRKPVISNLPKPGDSIKFDIVMFSGVFICVFFLMLKTALFSTSVMCFFSSFLLQVNLLQRLRAGQVNNFNNNNNSNSNSQGGQQSGNFQGFNTYSGFVFI